MPEHEIHGFAIVADDGCIADATGATPQSLRNPADWAYFQGWLDRAAVTVLGRLGHLANPNQKRRRRLILSSGARGLERRGDGWWWNPAEAALAEALAAAAPEGGVVAVPGGRRVFDLFLESGFDVFHLSRKRGLRLPGGVKAFSALGEDGDAEALLRSRGLTGGRERALDPAAGVTLRLFRRRSAGAATAPVSA